MTLLQIRWAQVETALTFMDFCCTSCYITCRRFRCLYGETMGKYGQIYGQFLTINIFEKLTRLQLISEHSRVLELALNLPPRADTY